MSVVDNFGVVGLVLFGASLLLGSWYAAYALGRAAGCKEGDRATPPSGGPWLTPAPEPTDQVWVRSRCRSGMMSHEYEVAIECYPASDRYTLVSRRDVTINGYALPDGWSPCQLAVTLLELNDQSALVSYSSSLEHKLMTARVHRSALIRVAGGLR